MTNVDKIANLDEVLGLLLDAEEELNSGVSKLRKSLRLLRAVNKDSITAAQLESYTIGNIVAFLTDEFNQTGNLCSIIEAVEGALRKAKKDAKEEAQ